MPETSLILHDPDGAAVSALPKAEELKELVLAECALIGCVRTVQQQESAVAVWAKLKRLRADAEKSRKQVKQIHLDRCREIDACHARFDAALDEENKRFDAMITDFQEGEREKAAQAERERQKELQRIERERQEELARIERERQEQERKVQAERDRIAREAAEIERKRLETEREAQRLAQEAAQGLRKKDREAAEAKALQETEERARLAKAEQDRLAGERAALEEKERLAAAERQRQADREADYARLKAQAVGPVVTSAKAKGQTSMVELDFEITDIHKLYLKNPGFVTLKENRAEIKLAINMGMRDLPGVRIFEVTKNKIRAAKVVAPIDVQSTVTTAPAQGQLLSDMPS